MKKRKNRKTFHLGWYKIKEVTELVGKFCKSRMIIIKTKERDTATRTRMWSCSGFNNDTDIC